MKKYKDRRVSNEIDERQELKVNENLLYFYNKIQLDLINYKIPHFFV